MGGGPGGEVSCQIREERGSVTCRFDALGVGKLRRQARHDGNSPVWPPEENTISSCGV